MKLELYLRSEVNQKIRPLFLKDECEHCGCTDDLHLHHQYEFFKIVDDVLNKLQLEMKDTEEYTEYELYLIKSCVLAEHLKDNYLTLCSECHRKEHENNHKRRSRNDIINIKDYDVDAICNMIESYANQKLFKEQQYELFNELYELGVNTKSKPCKTMKAVNKWLSEYDVMTYDFITKEEKGRNEHRGQRYLLIKKQNRIELLESVIGKRLTTAEFKELTQELNFTNPKNGRLIANPKNEIAELGYKVNDKKSNGSRFKVITRI